MLVQLRVRLTRFIVENRLLTGHDFIQLNDRIETQGNNLDSDIHDLRREMESQFEELDIPSEDDIEGKIERAMEEFANDRHFQRELENQIEEAVEEALDSNDFEKTLKVVSQETQSLREDVDSVTSDVSDLENENKELKQRVLMLERFVAFLANPTKAIEAEVRAHREHYHATEDAQDVSIVPHPDEDNPHQLVCNGCGMTIDGKGNGR